MKFDMTSIDGSVAGTAIVKDIVPSGSGSYPDYLVASGDTLFFTARDSASGNELWKTDGTSEGTVLVKAVHDSFAEVVEIKSVTAADGTLAGATEQCVPETAASVRRIGKSEAWCEILVVPSPIRGFSIRLPA